MREAKPVLDRRHVIASGAALLGTAALPRAGAAADEGLAPAADLLGRVHGFLSGLEPDQRKAASFAWNGSEWRGWNYFGATGYVKPGLRLEQMTAAQKEAAWGVLGAVWSPAGVAKARNVMLLQDILAASGQRRRPALVGAVLACGVRHARRDRRLGLSLRGTSPDAIGRGAR